MGSMPCQNIWLGSRLQTDGTTADRAQPQHRFGAIDDEAGMHLYGDLHAHGLRRTRRASSNMA